MNEVADEIEKVNITNSSLLTQTESGNQRLRDASLVLENETEKLRCIVERTHQKLLRFGILSHLFRLLRAKWWGSYYADAEVQDTDALAMAVNDYRQVVLSLRAKLSART